MARLTDREPVPCPGIQLPTGWFRVLKVGHDPRDPPEATLVLAAAAAANGLRCDGQPMAGAEFTTAPSLNAIARQLCLHIDTVRRGVEYLVKVGAVHVDNGVLVDPSALTSRWAKHRQRIHITTEARWLRMRAKPLLLTALVAGQVDQRGQLRLGIEFLVERTGFSRRGVDRALRTARNREAIHTWNAPPKWQMFLALGPARSGARRGSQGGARRPRSKGVEGASEPLADGHDALGGRETAQPPIAKRRDPHCETASTGSQSGARPPEVHPEVHPDSRPETPAAPAGETRVPSSTAPPRDLIRHVVEPWLLPIISKGVETLDADNSTHVFWVLGLIDRLGPNPPVIRSGAGLRQSRMAMACDAIRWCPRTERLATWLARAASVYGVENLPGYLRESISHGDPGTLLESEQKNRVGRAAERWRDFTPETENALQGPRAVEVAQMTAALGAVLCATDDAERDELREALRRYVEQGRPAAARCVLLKLVGTDRSDLALQRAVDGILSLDEAKRLLEAAA
jgi:hypothetical protein